MTTCTRCGEPLYAARDGIPDPTVPDGMMHWQHHGQRGRVCNACGVMLDQDTAGSPILIAHLREAHPERFEPRDLFSEALDRREGAVALAEPCDPDRHTACGRPWAQHDNRQPDRPLPFGCPE